MTTNRAPILILLTVLAAGSQLPLAAAPPEVLSGKYVSLNGERLEFPDAASGSGTAGDFQYTYAVPSETSASLQISYPATGRQRSVTLNFAIDGTAADYQEFDFASMNPPMPPMVRSGLFEIGNLESPPPPPPPAASTAPESLVGSFVMAGGHRYEFLTGSEGRCFRPGASAYLTYEYSLLEGNAAELVFRFDGSEEPVLLGLEFDDEGEPLAFRLGEKTGGFVVGVNRHLADLKIGGDGTGMLGGDRFTAFGRHQTARIRSSSMAPVVFPFEIENDGDTDTFGLRAGGTRRRFEVACFAVPGGENVTAAILAGTLATGELAHGEVSSYRIEVTPERARGAFHGRVVGRSLSVAGARDAVHAHVQVKARPEPPKGKAGKPIPGKPGKKAKR